MTLFFKVGEKPKNPPKPEMVTIEHKGVAVELPKLGSMTYGEMMAWNDFRASLEQGLININELSADRYVLIACLAYSEIREATISPSHEPDLSIARQIAEGESPESLGLTLQNGEPLTPDLMLEVYTKFWKRELESWSKKKEEKPESEGNDQQTGTEST